MLSFGLICGVGSGSWIARSMIAINSPCNDRWLRLARCRKASAQAGGHP